MLVFAIRNLARKKLLKSGLSKLISIIKKRKMTEILKEILGKEFRKKNHIPNFIL